MKMLSNLRIYDEFLPRDVNHLVNVRACLIYICIYLTNKQTNKQIYSNGLWFVRKLCLIF